MKLFKNSVFVLVVLLFAHSAHSASVDVTIAGTVAGGTFDGTVASGTVTYNDALIIGSGDESVTTEDGLLISLTLFGQTFDETDHILAPLPAELIFDDGAITHLDFEVHEYLGSVTTPITTAGVYGFYMFEVVESDGGLTITGDIIVDEMAPVPLPAALPLLFVGCGLLARYSTRRA